MDDFVTNRPTQERLPIFPSGTVNLSMYLCGLQSVLFHGSRIFPGLISGQFGPGSHLVCLLPSLGSTASPLPHPFLFLDPLLLVYALQSLKLFIVFNDVKRSLLVARRITWRTDSRHSSLVGDGDEWCRAFVGYVSYNSATGSDLFASRSCVESPSPPSILTTFITAIFWQAMDG
jgi:hypothetical protein